MKPHPRIRKTVKWGGAVVSVLLLVVWVGSGWFAIYIDSPRGDEVQVRAGQLGVYYRYTSDGPDARFWWTLERHGPALSLNPSWTKHISCGVILIPLWIPLASTLLLWASAWRLDTLARRRARIGFCPKCGYNRTGLAPGAVCPECGAAAPVAGAPA